MQRARRVLGQASSAAVRLRISHPLHGMAPGSYHLVALLPLLTIPIHAHLARSTSQHRTERKRGKPERNVCFGRMSITSL